MIDQGSTVYALFSSVGMGYDDGDNLESLHATLDGAEAAAFALMGCGTPWAATNLDYYQPRGVAAWSNQSDHVYIERREVSP